MLPNEKFALECRDRYAEDGLVVDQSNGEFSHCPLPKGLGETGYYLLHDDHQWQGLLQSKDVGRRCFWTPDVKRWLLKAPFVNGYFDLWCIFDEFNKATEKTKRKISVSKSNPSEKTRRRMRAAWKRRPPTSKETREKLSEASKGEKNPMFGRTGELSPIYGKNRLDVSERNRKQTGELNPMFGRTGAMSGRTGEFHPAFGRRWWNDGKGNTKFMEECPGDGWKLGRK